MEARFLLGVVLVVAGLTTAPAPAHAYDLESCAWPTTSVAYADRTGSYAAATEQAVRGWNAAGSPVHLHPDPAAPFTLEARDFGRTGFDGITIMRCGGDGRFVRVTTSYNTYYADRYGTDARASLIGHEIGHALGLAHSGSPPCPVPLMYSSSDRYFRCGEVGPQADDVAGLRAVVRRSAR